MGWRDTLKEDTSSWRDTEAHEDKTPMFTSEGSLRGMIEALPLTGAMIGGAMGTGLGATAGSLVPVAGTSAGAIYGGMAGAGLGGALGKSAENALEALLLEDQKSREEIYRDPVLEGVATVAGESAGQMLPVIGSGIKKGAKKLASSMSKIPERVLEVYAERAPQVKKLASSTHDDLLQGADAIRTNIQDKTASFKTAQNARISGSLAKDGQKMVDMSSAATVLQDNIKKLKPDLHEKEIARMQEALNKIIDMGQASGNALYMSADDAYDVQKFLQSQAEYLQPGQAFKKKDFVDISMERAASRARQSLKGVAPEISAANAEIGKIRRLDKNINKNLIAPDKPFGALMTAGSGENQLGRSQLKRVGEAVGEDFLPEAENLAAASYFNNAGILPREKTGASLVPMITGGSYALNEASEGNYGNAMAGLAMGALGSPLAIKGTINASRGLSRMLPMGTGQMMRKAPQAILQSLRTEDPRIEGFRAADTQLLQSPQDAQAIDGMIQKDSKLTPSQKAKQLILLRKHGRIYIGQ